MGQERLSSLAIISIENEVANNIDFDDDSLMNLPQEKPEK